MPDMDRRDILQSILCWMADTQVEYLIEGKRPGTASYERYAKYSKAKTVGEALALGSKAEDLVNDFHKKILKVVGGPVREKPLEAAEVLCAQSSTETDRALSRFAKSFHRNQMVGQLGTDSKASKERSWVETAEMRSKRLLAEKHAEGILKGEEPITDAHVLEVLRKWGFRRNNVRRGVTPEGMAWVESDTLGMTRNQAGVWTVSIATRDYPAVNQLLVRWFRGTGKPSELGEEFPFTSIHVNSGFASRRHRDHGSAGPAAVRAFGDFSGGQLVYWPEDDQSAEVERLPDAAGRLLDVRAATAAIDGGRAHEVRAFEGERFSLVFYTIEKHQKMPQEAREQLQSFGFQVPTEEALNSAKALFQAPAGYPAADLKPPAASAQDAPSAKEKKEKDKQKKAEKKEKLSKCGKLKFGLFKLQSKSGKPQGEAGGESQAPGKLTSKKIMASGLLARVLASQPKASDSKQGSKGGSSMTQEESSDRKLGEKSEKRPQVLKFKGVVSGGGSSMPQEESSPPKLGEKSEGKPQGFRPKGVIAGGLLARVFAKRALEADDSQAGARPNGTAESAGRKALKAGSQGRFLARMVAKRTIEPKAEAGNEKEASMTPAKKKPRAQAALCSENGPFILSGKKERGPIGRSGQQNRDATVDPKATSETGPSSGKIMTATTVLPQNPPKVASLAREPVRCYHFLPLVNALRSLEQDPCAATAVLANYFQTLVQGADQPEELICAALRILEQAGTVPAQVLVAAVAEAFGPSTAQNANEENLAELALEGRRSLNDLHSQDPRILLTQVAEVAASYCNVSGSEAKNASGRLARLLVSSRVEGREVYWLLRLLQGRGGLPSGAVHAAVARALVLVR